MRRTVFAVLSIMMMLGATFAGGVAAAAQTDTGVAPEPIVVTFETADGSTFRTVLEQPADIARAEAALAGDGNAGIPNGALAYSPGEVNAPHAWHMQDTTLADMTIELCDGTATMVDDDVTYWVGTVGQFCPWNATVVDIEPLDDSDLGEEIRELISQLIATLLAILDDLQLGP